jgi:hypothetical protein
MAFNLAWIKEHKFVVAGIILGGFVLIYFVKKNNANSSSGVAGVLAQQNAGQLQMAQLNAQLSAQGQQTQAQLESQQISAQTQQQQEQDQVASQIALYGLQGSLEEKALVAQQAQQSSLLPLEQELINYSGSGKLSGHPQVQQTIENELALLLAEGGGGNPSFLGGAGGLPPIQPGSGGGLNLTIPGLGSLGYGGL